MLTERGYFLDMGIITNECINEEEWSKMRKQGIVLYLLLHWFFAAAIPVAVVTSLIRGMFKGGIAYIISIEYLKNLFFYIIFCTVISIFFGVRKWRAFGKQNSSDRARA